MTATISKRVRKKHPYYSFNRIRSYNGTFNFIVGGRGLGKTFGAKEESIKKFIKFGEQFIYLRRYYDELIDSKQTFFSDVQHSFPQHDFRVQGNVAQIASKESADDKKRTWLTMGYFLALSKAQSTKSVSFHDVTTIIYDEFIIEKGLQQYLPAEATAFVNFYSTVDRYQDKTKVFFLANSVSIMNPYFLEYDIKPDEVDGEFIRKADGFIVAHFPDSDDFKNSVYATSFGRFIAQTEYARYAVGNEFADNALNLITAKDPKARYLYTLETLKGTFSVWHNVFNNEFYATKFLPKQQNVYTMLANKMSEDKTLMLKNDKLLQYLRTAFRHARLTFDEQSTRNAFAEIFKA